MHSTCSPPALASRYAYDVCRSMCTHMCCTSSMWSSCFFFGCCCYNTYAPCCCCYMLPPLRFPHPCTPTHISCTPTHISRPHTQLSEDALVLWVGSNVFRGVYGALVPSIAMLAYMFALVVLSDMVTFWLGRALRTGMFAPLQARLFRNNNQVGECVCVVCMHGCVDA